MPKKSYKKFKKQLVKNKSSLILGAIFLVVLLASVLYFFTYQKSGDRDIKAGNIAGQWLSGCNDEACIRKGLEAITMKYGTVKAIESLESYINSEGSLIGDNHLRVHHIGRQAAISFGHSGKSFLECNPSFNYGCMHGFFEVVLADAESPEKAGDTICRPIEASSKYSSNNKYYCYHGVGHGVMMANAYNLTDSLGACDKLNSELARTGCWQGVFMENVNGQMNGGAREGVFSKTDPLAPCNVVEDKYQRECYINHHGYLFKFYDWDVVKSANACLAAGTQTATCLEGIGLAATSEIWQKILLKEKASKSLENNGWEICKAFPSDYVTQCVTGAVVSILQMDRFRLEQANKFCNVVDSFYQNACYRRIGEYLKLESSNSGSASYCTQLPAEWQAVCREGAQQ